MQNPIVSNYSAHSVNNLITIFSIPEKFQNLKGYLPILKFISGLFIYLIKKLENDIYHWLEQEIRQFACIRKYEQGSESKINQLNK